MKKQIVAALALLLLTACVTTARLYNLDTGEVLNASYSSYGTGHGKITLTRPNGQKLTGEYSTLSDTQMTTSFGSAGVSSGGQYAWATGQGFSFTTPGRQYGSAVCVGDGLVIEVVYTVDPWTGHGQGVGKDNKGGKYRLQF